MQSIRTWLANRPIWVQYLAVAAAGALSAAPIAVVLALVGWPVDPAVFAVIALCVVPAVVLHRGHQRVPR